MAKIKPRPVALLLHECVEIQCLEAIVVTHKSALAAAGTIRDERVKQILRAHGLDPEKRWLLDANKGTIIAAPTEG